MQYWWVCQGQTFKQEREGGYLWAPKKDGNGKTNYYWTNMQKVREGDVVYSYVNQSICAVGTATSTAHDFVRPAELEENWERDGWRVTIEYKDIRPQKPLADFVRELRPLLPPRYGPLDVNGGGKVGYLFELPQKAGELIARVIGLRSGERTAASISQASLFRLGERVLHESFGLGTVVNVNSNKLTIEFDNAERRIVVDSFVKRVS